MKQNEALFRTSTSAAPARRRNYSSEESEMRTLKMIILPPPCEDAHLIQLVSLTSYLINIRNITPRESFTSLYIRSL